MAKTKGPVWQACLEYLKTVAGTPGIEKVKAAISDQDRELLFSKQVLSNQWIDFGAFMRFVVTADKVLGHGDFEIVKENARYCVRKNFTGIYKFIIKIATPQYLLSKGKLCWDLTFDSGKFEVRRLGKKHIQFLITDFTDTPLHHEHDFIASTEEFLHLTGVKHMRASHPLCMARGNDCCMFDVTWE
jgi:hypothetical protein